MANLLIKIDIESPKTIDLYREKNQNKIMIHNAEQTITEHVLIRMISISETINSKIRQVRIIMTKIA